jgi:SseB protein N-terminal domain
MAIQPSTDDVASICTHRALSGHDEGETATVSLRDLSDGQRALLMYSSLASLRACRGDDAPWMALTADAVLDVVERAECDLVVLDLPVEAEPVARKEPEYQEYVDDEDPLPSSWLVPVNPGRRR